MTRRRAKCFAVTGSTLTAVIVAFYIASIWYGLAWRAAGVAVVIGHGVFGVAWTDPHKSVGSGWELGHDPGPFTWLPMVVTDNGSPPYYGAFGAVLMPLWLPLLAVVVPTIFFIRIARRWGPGLCPTCGYNLTGAPSPTCPECGRSMRVV